MLPFEAFFKDLRHSLRMFRQSPAFTLAAVAALTLGIGVNTAIFSVVNAVLLRPLSFPDPDRLVVFMNTSPQGSGPGASPAKFMHFRQQSSVVQDVSAYSTGIVNYTGGSFPEQLRSGRVSADFFRLFGAPIVRGRAFTEAEDRPQGPRVALLGYRLWTTRFDGDPAIVGKTDLSRRRAVQDHRRRRRLQLRAVRHAAAGLDSVPVRSEHGRPGALLPRRPAG